MLSLVEKYEVLLLMNKDKISSSVKNYEVLSSLDKDMVSSPINSDTDINRGFAEKNMAKPSS